MESLKHCVIATRESPLAMWQALHIQARLRAQYPEAAVELLGMTTKGDQILDRTLSKVGGKGLFVKELEAAMLAGEADLAVHSLKDVPMELPEGFVLAAVAVREDPRDAFVSPKYESLEALPAGAVVGTSSLRRELMLRAKFPHLKVASIRGNVGTRLAKLDRGAGGERRASLPHVLKRCRHPDVLHRRTRRVAGLGRFLPGTVGRVLHRGKRGTLAACARGRPPHGRNDYGRSARRLRRPLGAGCPRGAGIGNEGRALAS